MSKLFNTQGELNASNVNDALSQIVKYASIIEDLQPSNAVQASQASLNDNQRDEMIKQALMTQEGKIALGQAMATPIRRNLDYQGVGRKALVVDPLPQGALPIYDRDIDVAAVVIFCVVCSYNSVQLTGSRLFPFMQAITHCDQPSAQLQQNCDFCHEGPRDVSTKRGRRALSATTITTTAWLLANKNRHNLRCTQFLQLLLHSRLAISDGPDVY